MYPRPIESYFAPSAMSEVLALLKQHGEHAKLLAGGQSLISLMKTRLLAPQALIDLNRVRGLDEIRQQGRFLRVGAMARHADVAAHPVVQRSHSLLADAAASIGDPQIRNRGTLAGSLVHADPLADYTPAAIALCARLVIAKADTSSRILSAKDFIVSPFTVRLAEDELVVRIEFPCPPPMTGGAYVKEGRVARDFAVVSVAAQITRDPDGRCERAAIVVGGLLPKPGRASHTEAWIQGRSLDAGTFARAGEAAADEIETQSDSAGSAEYRKQLIRATVPTALLRAVTRVESGGSV